MTNIPSSSPSVPSICILGTDDSSELFNDDNIFLGGHFNLNDFTSPNDTGSYACSQGIQVPYRSMNAFPNTPAELDDMPELSHLTTTDEEYLTGHRYSHPYGTILQENGTIPSLDGRLSPCALGSPIHSPSPSYGSSLSPSSLHDALAFSEFESHTNSPATSDRHFPWPIQESTYQSSDSLDLYPSFGSFPNDSVAPGFLDQQPGPHRARSKSSPPRRGPVASKAMLEANGRRRRHPAQHACPQCDQTFTALFSLRRHVQSHTGERPFECGIPGCRQRFFNSSDCKRHEKSKKRHKDLLMQ